MRTNNFQSTLKTALRLISILPLVAGASFAQSVSLTAAATNTTLPDGSVVPMWGYSCSAAAVAPATCAALNLNAPAGTWSPVVITVPPGPLTISLTNNLPASVPETSLVIVGQLGGGLGTTASTVASPAHATQGATWPIAGDTSGATFNPPPQGARVQTFASEVTTGNSLALSWTSLKPGTYLIESGTHPSIQGPMGLYGVLVVTAAPPSTGGPGTAYPGITYSADVPFLFSEIDPILNNGINAAVRTAGFSETSVSVLRDTVSSVTVNLDGSGNPIGGTGYSAGNPVTISGGGFTVQATAHISAVGPGGTITAIAIDNPGKGYTSVPNTVTALGGTGAQLTANLSLQGDICSGGAPACYPPAVNYMPLYYLVNGSPFNKTSPSTSLFASKPPLGVTGNVLVRMVNAGLRMHVPSIVGAQTTVPPATVASAGFSLIAEDGNPLPGGRQRQQARRTWPLVSLLPIAANSGTLGQVQSRLSSRVRS